MTQTRSNASIPCSSSVATSSASSRRARMPAWTRGCSVFTRPPSISGEAVTSSTCSTGRPIASSAAAVFPLATSRQPSATSPRANAVEAGLVPGRDQRAHSSLTTSGSSRCSTACTRSRSVSTVSSGQDGDALGGDHRAGVDALVDVVDGRRRLVDARPRARPRSGARRGTPAAAPSGCSRSGRRSSRRTACGTGACSRRERRARRRVTAATRRSRRPAPRGSRSRDASNTAVSMPAVSARSSARTSGLFETTQAIGSPASISAWRFVPSPLTSTPITRSARSRARPARRRARPRTSRCRG